MGKIKLLEKVSYTDLLNPYTRYTSRDFRDIADKMDILKIIAIEISGDDYDGVVAHKYMLETEEEAEARVLLEKQRKERAEAADLSTYKRLKNKYEGK